MFYHPTGAKEKQGEDKVFIYQSRFPGDHSAGLGR
jgi:hypothetical protein